MHKLTSSLSGIDGDRHSATLTMGKPGVLHGVRTYILQSPEGQIIETHSISAGLDYPGVGPEHAWLKDTGRAEYVVATDEEALRGFRLCTELEGIIPGTSVHFDKRVDSSQDIGGSARIFTRRLGSHSPGQDIAARPGCRPGRCSLLSPAKPNFPLCLLSVCRDAVTRT